MPLSGRGDQRKKRPKNSPIMPLPGGGGPRKQKTENSTTVYSLYLLNLYHV